MHKKKKKTDIKPHDMHRSFFMKISTKRNKKQTNKRERKHHFDVENLFFHRVTTPRNWMPNSRYNSRSAGFQTLLNTTSISINYCSTLYLHNFSFRLIRQDPLAFLGLQKNVECRRIEKLVIHIARLLSEEIRQLHSLGHFLKLPQRIKFSIIIKFSPSETREERK